MISLKCSVCHGELIFRDDQSLECPYCGNRFVMSSEEMTDYGNRRREVLHCLRSQAAASEQAALLDQIWQKTEPLFFRTRTGEPVNAACLYESEQDGVRILTARRSVLFVFPPKRAMLPDRYNRGVSLLQFPPTDSSRLEASFPRTGQIIPLSDGSVMLAISKPETIFPLAMFGALTPEHAAWIVSRTENICCVLAFSGLCHGAINEDHLFINPWTHEAALFGGWQCTGKGDGRQDLQALRSMILRVMGPNLSTAPAAFRIFLHSAPRSVAYDDFAAWDKVIETGFGGRRFVQMDVNNIL